MCALVQVFVYVFLSVHLRDRKQTEGFCYVSRTARLRLQLCTGGCRVTVGLYFEGRAYESIGPVVYISGVKSHLHILYIYVNVCVCSFGLIQCVRSFYMS